MARKAFAAYEMSAVDWFELENLPRPLFLPLQNLVEGNSHPRQAWQDAVAKR